MTSEVDGLKTNEFIRRRNLRLQQVREQSKDIARKIRQRAKVENLRQVIELDSKKKKQYLQRQEQLVKKLEEYYATGLENVGSSHKNASEVRLQGDDGDKIDLSKRRGQEAAAELRKKRQQILDKQKKLLDRKLQAREVANEISRDKSGAAVNKAQPTPANTSIEEPQSKSASAANFDPAGNNKKNSDVARSDMATQWDFDEMPNEWESNIPTLILPQDDNSIKESNNNNVDSKSDKSKRIDLFAVSEEMPSSLRGGLTNQEERVPMKSSLSLVSEYLQNRDLRLRETDTTRTNKKTEDFQSLKQTILRTRTSKEAKEEKMEKQFKSSKGTDDSLNLRKSVVTMYNHTTRDSRDIPCSDERLVIRNPQDADDAYSQAMKESTANHSKDKDNRKKVQEIRSKVAMTKQNVEKEYRDTISFLNALPKDKGNRPIKAAYMDEHRQQMQKEMRQQKLQQEYRKIVKECSKHNCKNNPRSKSRSPVQGNSDVFESTDMQYSWMPVPENDDLAIHTIPTTLREGKNNSVKFSKVDSYHEYRSRHKHTPPTKETTGKPRQLDAVESFEQQDSSDSDSVSSDSSVKSVRLVKQDKPVENNGISDAERIIIYKILDTKVDERKKATKLMKDIAKSLTRIEEKTKTDVQKTSTAKKSSSDDNAENLVSIEQLAEGVYKTVNENGDNIASMYFHNKEAQATEVKDVPKCCARCKKHSKQSHKVTPLQQWDGGDEIKTRCSPHTTECNCSCKTAPSKGRGSPVGQPSIATSTTSFLTAANDKASSAASEGGFVKLVDDGGREAGKFYIGASGLLNDDAYELVIQLRKKGEEKELSSKKSEIKTNEAPGADVVTTVSSTQTSLKDIYNDGANRAERGNEGSDITEPQESKKQETERDSYRSEGFIDRGSRQTIYSGTFPQSTDNIKTSQPNESKVSVKGVSAIIEDAPNATNAQNVPESQPAPAPRPATTTYTQTTADSPPHRPVLFHMSSSTSTAYMSPPEMIVPNFMKPGYQITDEDVYDPRNYAVGEIITEQHEYSEALDCDCRKCMHARRLKLTKRDVHAPRHRCRSARNPSTPPNTVGSARSEVLEHMYFQDDRESVPAHVINNANKQSKRTSRKFASHDDYDSHSHKKLRHSAHSSQNIALRVLSSTSSKKGQLTSKRSKTGLNPVIKNYVDKLLKLNKESLKAVQVVDQDCSLVATPGSSVVNVPNNIDKSKSKLENKLSLEKIRDILKQKIIDESKKKSCKSYQDNNQNTQNCSRSQNSKNVKVPKLLRKKTAHKVKSLNISRKMCRVQTCDSRPIRQNPVYSSSSIKEGCTKKQWPSPPIRSKIRSKSSPTPRLPPNSDTTDRSRNSDKPKFSRSKSKSPNVNTSRPTLQISGSSNPAVTSSSNDSDRNVPSLKDNNMEVPMSISTQTSINVDSEMNYMRLAEDKLQNMEKIADLTEKCTKRLSSLAKVLEEVRKNKTLVYSHISTSDATSDSDQKSDKNVNNIPLPQEPSNENCKKSRPASPDLTKKNTSEADNFADYVPFLSNIPKPVAFNSCMDINSSSSSSRKSNSSPVHENVDQINKHRGKPPPALSRMHLKCGQDVVVPHELSTVVEVDSPMSIKLKSSRNDTRADEPDTSNNRTNGLRYYNYHIPLAEFKMGDANNPDLLDNNKPLSEQHKKSAVTWSDNMDSVQMIDIEQFNEIMLKPFFSLQEFAKQCNIGALDDASNLDDILKDDHINDELSSLHSEASLPDVISELLKRNIISEPFKFDSGSNANSTTVSSESTISVLALSRARQGTNRPSTFKVKDNIGETSDTMSISSNPDLENAFKKLGMGWASSTLKKTKERLALSSSSNTSSSSLLQFRVKGFNQEIPEPVTDTVSSIMSLPNKQQQRVVADNSKNAEQQTSKTKSMTVKEFLTNELAKKITFNNKSKNETTEQYASLYETKMPEEMKHSSLIVREESHSINNSLVSANNNRARTSTPVQLYKSMTYHSSSSSNMSNGLFSNADDLSSVKVTSNSMKHSTSDKDDLIIPNISLRTKKGSSDCTKSD